VTLRILTCLSRNQAGQPRFPLLAPLFFCLIAPIFYIGLGSLMSTCRPLCKPAFSFRRLMDAIPAVLLKTVGTHHCGSPSLINTCLTCGEYLILQLYLGEPCSKRFRLCGTFGVFADSRARQHSGLRHFYRQRYVKGTSRADAENGVTSILNKLLSCRYGHEC